MMKLKTILIILFAAITLQSYAKKDLLTIAEKSDFTSTALSTDVYKFIEQLKKSSDFIKVESIATSTYGNDIPLLILANPMPASPKDLENDDRIVVYIQANIHAGEVEGKEASLMLARDLLKDPNSEIFKKVVLLIVPNLNPDGNDQISTQNRTNQVGPANGVGLRHNGQQLDINRDGLKLETPEFEGILNNIFNRWDPALTVDCHTTNGSYHEEAVTFTWMMNPNGDRQMINYMRDLMMPSVNTDLFKKYNIENCYYGEFIDRMNPEKGWISYASAPRYLTNYIGIRNRFSILNENYVYADYKSRVIGCYYLLKTIVEYATEHSQEMKAQIAEADRKTIERGIAPAVQDSFAIQYKGVPIPEKVTIKFIEAEYYNDENGRRRMRKTDRKRTVTVPYIADYFPSKQVKFPYAYIIDKKDKVILKNLKTHGIQVEQLKEDTEIEVTGFEFDEIKPSAKHNQGHYNNMVKGHYKVESKLFKAGTYVVRTSQKLANVAAYLLEAETEDGLLYWNYFDRYLRPQWGSRMYPYPVYKVIQATDLKTN